MLTRCYTVAWQKFSAIFVLAYDLPTLHAILSTPRNIQDAVLPAYVVLVHILHDRPLNCEQIRQGGSYAGWSRSAFKGER
jgi:hypothetical protein